MSKEDGKRMLHRLVELLLWEHEVLTRPHCRGHGLEASVKTSVFGNATVGLARTDVLIFSAASSTKPSSTSTHHNIEPLARYPHRFVKAGEHRHHTVSERTWSIQSLSPRFGNPAFSYTWSISCMTAILSSSFTQWGGVSPLAFMTKASSWYR